jgi:hypothetical protein
MNECSFIPELVSIRRTAGPISCGFIELKKMDRRKAENTVPRIPSVSRVIALNDPREKSQVSRDSDAARNCAWRRDACITSRRRTGARLFSTAPKRTKLGGVVHVNAA